MSKEKDDTNSEVEGKLTDIPGIGPGIAVKLEAAGIYDLMGLAVMSPPALSEIAGIGEAVARKAIQAARGVMKLGFTDGMELSRARLLSVMVLLEAGNALVKILLYVILMIPACMLSR